MQSSILVTPALSVSPLVYFVFALAIGAILAGIVSAAIRLAVAARNGRPFDYLFNSVEYRERQREKIRAGFRRNRRPYTGAPRTSSGPSDEQGLWRRRDGEWKYINTGEQGGDQLDTDHP